MAKLTRPKRVRLNVPRDTTRVAVEFTSRCNLQCAMCGHITMTRAKQDMSWDLWQAILNEIQDSGGAMILWQMHFMGEILCNLQFEDALRNLVERRMEIWQSFSTNSTLLTPERTASIIDAGFLEVHRKTQMIRLAVDTLDPDVYRKLRVGAELGPVLVNVRHFIAETKKYLPGLQIQRLVTRWNADEKEEDFAKTFPGVPIRTQWVGRHQDKERDLTVTRFETQGDRRAKCKLLWGPVWVGAEGQVGGCCLDCDFRQNFGWFLIGDCFGDNQLQDVIKGRVRREQREQFKDGEYGNLPQCAICTGNECRGIGQT